MLQLAIIALQIIPSITVIIPAYNAEKYIQTSVQSVINQSLQNKEIIVVNDGSTDSTKSALRKLQITYPNLIFYNLEQNMGPLFARQYGVQKSRGEYVLQLDADDSLRHQHVLKDLLAYTIQKPDILHFQHQAVKYFPDNSTQEISWWGNAQVESANSSNMLNMLVHAQIHWLIHGKLIKRTIFAQAIEQINDTRHLIYGDDEVLCIAVFSIAQSYNGVPYIGYNFNQRQDSVTGQRNQSLQTQLKVITDYFSTRDLVQKFLPPDLFNIRNRITKDYEVNLQNLAKLKDNSIVNVCTMYKIRGIDTQSLCNDIQ
ncbi:Glycosyl_transferase family 2 protein [Hexamita inflata]|uniref:Glycosyl transferase family 2 protein n=1 Tax=Hexamita inflata TaxID=28002 RepID=A0AA86NS20_9EUKA|nr:Glycosyl transferase family 2 protein [Hexamita inflata]